MSPDLIADLSRAIAADEIHPHFQPLVELRTGRVSGFEVLARWHHPTSGIIYPNDFIPFAEQTGLIGPLTENLLPRACRAARAWPDHLTLSVNLSPVQLSERALAERLRAVMDGTGFPFDRLVFEITEAVSIGDLDLARDITHELTAFGAGLALDDFGIGYANIRQLQVLPFDRLKIDASFVRSMEAERVHRQIVASMIGLGHNLGLRIVAEGIETPKQAEMLTGLGCDVGQGWLFGRAVPAEQVPALIADLHGRAGADRPLARIAEDVALRLETVPSHCISQLRALYDNAPVGLGLLDGALRYVALNKRLADMHDAPVVAHLGRPANAMIQPDLYAKIEPCIRRALAGETVLDFESRWRGPGGPADEHVLLASYQPVHDAAGEVMGVSVAVVDITERDRARRDAYAGTGAAVAAASTLTPRQRQVLDLVATGRSVKEIARELGLALGTVKAHLAQVYRVLGARNRIEALAHAGLTLEHDDRRRAHRGSSDKRDQTKS